MNLYAYISALELGVIFSLVGLGVFFTFRVLDFPDLTVDGSFPLGAAVSAVLVHGGWNPGLALLISILAGIIAGLCTAWWLLRTELGLALRASGNNPIMARAMGISTPGMIWLGLGISNGLTAFAGGLYAQAQGSADVGMGIGTVVAGLAAVIIGEALFPTRRMGWVLLRICGG